MDQVRLPAKDSRVLAIGTSVLVRCLLLTDIQAAVMVATDEGILCDAELCTKLETSS